MILRTLTAFALLALVGASSPALANESSEIISSLAPPLKKVCTAQNRSGRLFRAVGWANQSGVQAEAMRACRYYSRNPGTCRPLGCRYYR